MTFPDRLEPAIARIAAARCHLVYHWQIGTDAMNYLLAFARVAPISGHGLGQPRDNGHSHDQLLPFQPAARARRCRRAFYRDAGAVPYAHLVPGASSRPYAGLAG